MSDEATTQARPLARPGLLDLQRRWRELGRLRMGAQVPSGRGTRPVKLETWRLTSHSQRLLEAAAEVFGGEVKVWEGAPVEGDNFELITGARSLPIIVPPGESLSQAYELWSGGGCKRRCGGPSGDPDNPSRQIDRDVPCACPFDIPERMELAAKGQACKPTTRLSVILPDVPDIGVWRLESHGYYAATELAGTYDLLGTEQGSAIRATLSIERRQVKKEGQPTRDFTVPIIEIHAKVGEVVAALGATGGVADAALPPVERKALPSERPARTETAPAVRAPASPEAAQFPDPAPIGDLQDWIVELTGDHLDGEIIDAANAVAGEKGAPLVESLAELSDRKVSMESRRLIRERLVAGP